VTWTFGVGGVGGAGFLQAGKTAKAQSAVATIKREFMTALAYREEKCSARFFMNQSSIDGKPPTRCRGDGRKIVELPPEIKGCKKLLNLTALFALFIFFDI
jgi:hypothetical protein